MDHDRPSDPELEQQTPPTTASPSSSTSHRSCYTCNSKKIRCDKKKPCSPCARSRRPCSYPASGPRVRRSNKEIMAEMASHIASLEKSLARATRGKERASRSGLKSPVLESPVAPPVDASEGRERSREDILVQKGSSSQYFNEILLSRVIEKVSPVYVDEKPTAFMFIPDVVVVGTKHRIRFDAAADDGITVPVSVSLQCSRDSLLAIPLTNTL